MLCDICRKKNATVHLTEIINDKIVEMHICQACAQTKAEELNDKFNMSDLLGSLAADAGLGGQREQLECSQCGLSYREFKKKGRLGCSGCYASFKHLLLPLLKKIHSSIRHVGKSPLNLGQNNLPKSKIEELHSRLQRAIQLEEYEEAAKLRDEIRRLTNE